MDENALFNADTVWPRQVRERGRKGEALELKIGWVLNTCLQRSSLPKSLREWKRGPRSSIPVMPVEENVGVSITYKFVAFITSRMVAFPAQISILRIVHY